jgi:hypothetical protein
MECTNASCFNRDGHYLFECTECIQERARLIPQKYRCSPNIVKYCALMYSNSVVELSKLSNFIRIVNSKVCPQLTIALLINTTRKRHCK